MVAGRIHAKARLWIWLTGALLLVLLLSGCSLANTAGERRAQGGVLDLSQWRFSSLGAARLTGEWEFYWGELLDPAAAPSDLSSFRSFIHIPGDWKGHLYKGRPLPGTGYATFRLRVLLPPGTGPLALHVPHIITAHKLWVNGTLVSEAGTVGRNPRAAVAQYRPSTIRLDGPGHSLDLVLQVSNYEHRAGGLIQPLELGDIKWINTRDQTAQLQLFALGGLLFLGVHYLFLYWLRPHESALLKLGLTGLLFVFYLGVVHDLILTDLPGGLWWEVHRKVYYIGPIAAMHLTIAVMQDFFPQESGRLPGRVLEVLTAVLVGLVLILPALIYTQFQPGLILSVLATLAYIVTVTIGAWLNRRKNANLILAFLVMAVVGVGAEINRGLGGAPVPGWMDALVWASLPLLLVTIHVRNHAEVLQSQAAVLVENEKLTRALKEQLSELRAARQLLTRQEDRQNRLIAEFLHNRVQAKLGQAGQLLDQLRSRIAGDRESLELANRVFDRLEDVSQNDIRLASHQLHPGAVSVGLTAALYTLADEYRERFEVTISLSPMAVYLDSPAGNGLPEATRLTAYRVVAEALNNVAAHAKATAVAIEINGTDGSLLVSVSDNGSGFAVGQISPGFGLQTIAARMAECGGTFSLENQPEGGTRLLCSIPIHDGEP